MQSDLEQVDPGIATVADFANRLNDEQVERFAKMILVQVDHAQSELMLLRRELLKRLQTSINERIDECDKLMQGIPDTSRNES